MHKGNTVVLGWNSCAERVLRGLRTGEALTPEGKPMVVSPMELGGADVARHIDADYVSSKALAQVAWPEAALVLIFFELRPGETPDEVDTRNVLVALQVARHTGPECRIIIELAGEEHADLLRSRLGDRIEPVFKGRMEADLISHTVCTPGKTTKLLTELADMKGNVIRALPLEEVADGQALTVEQLRRSLLDRDKPMVFLGILRQGTATPDVNPGKSESIESGDMIYCLTEA